MPRKKTWKELTLNDHFIFELVMQNVALCRSFLSCVCKRPIGPLAIPPQAEKTLDSAYMAKGVRLDIFARDKIGNTYDIELQKKRKKLRAVGLRNRLYQSLVDQNTLEKGQEYHRLRTFRSIFICSFDPFYQGLRRYTFRTRCNEKSNLVLPDRTEKIFLNIQGTKGQESPDMLAFLEYMATGIVRTAFVAAFDAEVRKIKANEEQRRRYMSLAMDYEVELDERYADGFADGESKGFADGEIKGKAAGEQQRSRDIAGRMLDGGLPLEQIAAFTGLSVEQVRELQR